MKHAWLLHVRADLVGGAVSAAVAIPLALGYGMFAFVALGGEYFSQGVVAGLLSATVAGFAATLLNDRSRAIYAPRVVTTFFIGALLRGMVNSKAGIFRSGDVELMVTLLLLTILLAGAFQLLFGWLRLGSLLKHTPYPVLAGFQNAAAMLLFLVQIGNVLGFARPVPIMNILAAVPTTKPACLLVGAVTFAVMWHAKRLLPKIPPVITALAAGSLTYYALRWSIGPQALGPVIGSGQFFSFGLLALPEMAHVIRHPQFGEVLPMVVTGALGLAFIASLDALLCARILEGGSNARGNSNRQLMRLGAGNMLSASVGGITSGLNLGPSLINRAFGARTPLSVVVNAGVVLLTICFLLPVLAWLPRAVLSGVIMVIAIQHIDATTLPLLRRLLSGHFSDRRAMAIDLGVSLAVTLLAVFVDIVTAVLVGVFAAMMLFLLRISGSVVRASYTCAVVRSRQRRDPHDDALLQEHGGRIHVLKLEGAIFFGSGERLFESVGAIVDQGGRCVIVDLCHVSDIDHTGARLMLEIFTTLQAQGIPLLFSHLQHRASGRQMLGDVGLLAQMGTERIFQDTDRALEWAEDYLLADVRGVPAPDLALQRQPLFEGFDAAQATQVRAALVARHYAAGSVVFRQGDDAAELFVITGGSASVQVPSGADGSTRLASFGPGTCFGEVALFDRKPRSATVVADSALDCLVLDERAFAALKVDAPAVAIQLLVNLGVQLATNLRNSNRMVMELGR